jgi:hypothetical protein
MYKIISMTAICVTVMQLSGCASIVNGTNQSISVKTVPITDANCDLKNNKGEWFVHPTPGSVMVHRSYEPLEVDCRKGNFHGHQIVKSSTKPMAFGNVLFGGPIGVGVDVANGSAYDYPELVTVPMKR